MLRVGWCQVAMGQATIKAPIKNLLISKWRLSSRQFQSCAITTVNKLRV